MAASKLGPTPAAEDGSGTSAECRMEHCSQSLYSRVSLLRSSKSNLPGGRLLRVTSTPQNCLVDQESGEKVQGPGSETERAGKGSWEAAKSLRGTKGVPRKGD